MLCEIKKVLSKNLEPKMIADRIPKLEKKVKGENHGECLIEREKAVKPNFVFKK